MTKEAHMMHKKHGGIMAVFSLMMMLGGLMGLLYHTDCCGMKHKCCGWKKECNCDEEE